MMRAVEGQFSQASFLFLGGSVILTGHGLISGNDDTGMAVDDDARPARNVRTAVDVIHAENQRKMEAFTEAEILEERSLLLEQIGTPI